MTQATQCTSFNFRGSRTSSEHKNSLSTLGSSLQPGCLSQRWRNCGFSYAGRCGSRWDSLQDGSSISCLNHSDRQWGLLRMDHVMGRKYNLLTWKSLVDEPELQAELGDPWLWQVAAWQVVQAEQQHGSLVAQSACSQGVSDLLSSWKTCVLFRGYFMCIRVSASKLLL